MKMRRTKKELGVLGLKRFFGILCIMVTAFVLVGCGGQQAEKQEMQKLVVGLMPDTDSVPFVIAQEKGFFKEEGVEVELQQYKSAMDRDSAMQSGNLDGAVSDMLAVAFAKSGGFDVKVTSFTDGSYRLVAGKDENVASPKDLAGKEVAVSKNTIIEYVTDQILRREGMPEDSIAKVAVPQIPTRLEMLQNGQLAAATMPEPMASVAIGNGCKYVTGSDELGINPGVIMFTEKAVKDKAQEIRAMYRAYRKAVKYLADTDRSEYIDLVMEKSGFPPKAKDVLELPRYREPGLPKESDVLDCIKWLNEKKLVKESYGYQDIVADILKQN